MRQHKLWLCTLLVLLLAALGAFGAAAETTVGISGAGSFKMEQVYVNVPELDVYFYALDGDGNSYSPIKVQAAGPELTLGDRRLEVRSVAAASDPICYILALDNSKSIAPSEFYTMLGGVRKLINAMGDDDQLMLYTTAGSTECVLPATSDKNLMYKALACIILILLTTSVGQPIVLYVSALGNVDQSLVEAAEVDGATKLQAFWKIKWPQIMPTTLYILVITTINSFQCFALIQLLTSGGPNHSTDTIMYYIYYTAFKLYRYGYGNAMGVILAIMIAVLSAVQFKVTRSD